ncbi:hypothetical protein D3C80_1160320 [compost metagenome]
MQNAFILFANGKARARTVGQVVDLFFNPRHGIFREDRRGADFACLVADDQLVVFDPDGAIRQMMRQRQRATHRDRFIYVLLVHFGVMLRAFGTDGWLNDMHQSGFMRLNTIGQGVQIQLCHNIILVRSRLTHSGQHTPGQSPVTLGYRAVYQGQSRVGRAGYICSCQGCGTAENGSRGR